MRVAVLGAAVFATAIASAASMLAFTNSALAQPYGYPDDRYRERGYRYIEPEYRYEQPEYEYRERRPRYRNRAAGFDEREYLRCNRDVLRAVRSGTMQSGLMHYQLFGRFEGRALGC